MANKSDALHDLLADYLIQEIKDPGTDPETGEKQKIDPRVLAVARAFIKDNPPEKVPSAYGPSGVLKDFLDEMGKLPFANKAGK